MNNGRVRKQEKRRCRERRDFVGSTPTSVNSPDGEGPKSKVRKQKTAADAFSSSVRLGLWTLDFGLSNPGCSSNGKTPGLQPGNRGSIPRRSTQCASRALTLFSPRARGAGGEGASHGTKRKVAGYGWPGRSAKAVSPCADEGSNPLPSAWNETVCLDGETEIIPCF
jgi:hypothetical protein